MKFFLDITLLPSGEANLGFLWHKVFQQAHIALVDKKIGANISEVAISIPGYNSEKSKDRRFPLGNKLRLLAEDETKLKAININKWLERLTDYCHIKSIKQVPESVKKYAKFSRKNVVAPFKKAQRRAEHLEKPLSDTIDFMLKEKQLQECELPFVYMESQTKTESGKKNRFRIFIEREFFDSPVKGTFDCYGLSKTATIPWFE